MVLLYQSKFVPEMESDHNSHVAGTFSDEDVS